MTSKFLILALVSVLSACNYHRVDSKESTSKASYDGFVQGSSEKVALQIEENILLEKSLIYESQWLKLRARVVEAEKFACECRSSELKLAIEMANYGNFDQRIPGEGFINEEQRIHWNAELQAIKATRITAEARASLLRRDLKDLRKKMMEQGYEVPEGSIFD